MDINMYTHSLTRFACFPVLYCISFSCFSIYRPQLYINGEFVGGTDVVTEMHESGELKEMLEEGNVKQSAADEKK